MANSPLLGGERAPKHAKGTSIEDLGPSDSSDSGSDLVGAVGAVETDDMGFDTGTNDDIRRAAGAGADVGDANLDSDSDAGGTGERAEAGRDTLRRDAPDIMPDRIVGEGSEEDLLADDGDRAERRDGRADSRGRARGDDRVSDSDKSIDA